jgi:hypothetical protein
MIRYSLLVLPIHQHSRDNYYEEHNQYVEQQKKWLESSWVPLNLRFDQIDKGLQRVFEVGWWLPPWRFNDIVGYLDIGMDMGEYLTGEIYLKRKFFPRDHRLRRTDGESTIRIAPLPFPHHFLHYCEIPKSRVYDLQRNESYLEALRLVLKNARKEVRERNRKFQLWLPNYDFDCFDFAKAHQQLRNKDRKEGGARISS